VALMKQKAICCCWCWVVVLSFLRSSLDYYCCYVQCFTRPSD